MKKRIVSVVLFLCFLGCTQANPKFFTPEDKVVMYNTVEFVKYKDGIVYIFADGDTSVFRKWKATTLENRYLFLLLPMDIEEYDKGTWSSDRQIVKVHKTVQIAAFDDKGILISREFDDLCPTILPWECLSKKLYRAFGKDLSTWAKSKRMLYPKYKNEYTNDYLLYVTYVRQYEKYGRIPKAGNSFGREEREREKYEAQKKKELKQKK